MKPFIPMLKKWAHRYLFALAGVMTGIEAVVNAFGVDHLPIPQWARGLLVATVIGSAFAVRLWAQKEVHDGDD